MDPLAQLAANLARDASVEGLVWLDDPQGRTYLGCTPAEWCVGPWREVVPRLTPTRDDPHPEWIGYVGYDGHACFARYESLVHVEGGRSAIVGAPSARLHALLEGVASVDSPMARVGALRVPEAEDHALAVHVARQHIAAGNVYQLNLARRWRAPFEGSALALFLEMRRQSPVPRGFFLDAGDHAVLSRTMERFLEWAPDDTGVGPVRSSPIKGTIARAGDDAGERARLRSDPKEHAEHSMIVDLVRNDLGRVAVIGSVEVEALLEVEPYAKLQHLVSTVRATTREGTDLSALLEATFPPGSVTGAPKRAAMRLIDELEADPRGVYCGALGYVSGTGRVDLAVAIRTAVVRDAEVTYHAGGGIVWASDPQREVAETELKARVFLDAIARFR